MTTFTERLMAELPDPDDIGTSEYRAVYDHVVLLVDGIINDFGEDDEPLIASERIYDSLDQMLMDVQSMTQAVTKALRT